MRTTVVVAAALALLGLRVEAASTFEGEVLHVEPATAARGMPGGTRLVLKTAQEELSVQLGPAESLERQGFVVEPGDKLTITVRRLRGAPPSQAAKHEAAEDQARTVSGGASKGVQACHDDIERWCRGVKPGGGRLGACLKKNAPKLSEKCRRWTQHAGPGHVDRAFMEIDAPSPR